MNRIKLVFLTAGLLSALSVGCASKSASDSQITTDIQSKLYADPVTKQGSVGVAVANGAVTLTGTVPGSDVELAAMKIANSTPGVRNVVDQMQVSGSPVATTPATGVAGNNMVGSAPVQPAKKTEMASQPVTAPARSELPPTVATPAPYTSAPVEERTPQPVARPVEPANVTIAAGERLSIRTIDAIDSGKMSDGQTLRASHDSPLVSRGQVVVPAGAPVTLQITDLKGASRIKGNSELSLRATSLSYRNRNFPISTSVFSEEGKARGKNTALKTGIGAGLGALIGGLAGGGKGAAIGAGAGGGAGFGINALSHGQQVKIPSETVLNFRLEEPLTVPAPHGDR